MYAQKEAMWGGAPPYKNHFIGSASSGKNLKTDPQLTMLSLLAGRCFNTLWLWLIELLQKRS